MPGYGATAEALFKMTLGNRIGVTLNNSIDGKVGYVLNPVLEEKSGEQE